MWDELNIACKTCQTGQMKRSRVFSLGPAGVALGKFFLGLAALVATVCIVVAAYNWFALIANAQERETTAEEMRKEGWSAEAISAVVHGGAMPQRVNADQLRTLTHRRFAAPDDRDPQKRLQQSAYALAVAVVSAMLGYLLLLKKWVLRCERCGATVATT